jgi:arylsulfatase A
MIFTDAHTSSSVCTPTRYNVLTGRYNWRTKLKSGVLNGYGPALIEDNRLTFASLCREQGYQTAMIGKWHLGMGLPIREQKDSERDFSKEKNNKNMYVDWSKPLTRTPTSNGFDYFWGHGASLDFPPYVYIENNRYTSTNVRYVSKKDVGINSAFRSGWIADNFDPHNTLDEFCDRAAHYIQKVDEKKPFCLYVPLTSPHTPIIPTKRWQGKSGIGDYGDFCMQTDAGVGKILKALDEKGIADNTIVIFTTDNGCSPAADIKNLQKHGHYPNGIYRGTKADIWEGGHRVPHIVRWPAQVKPGTQTSRLTVLGDIVATMADICEVPLADHSAEDSVSYHQVLKGVTIDSEQHKAVVHHSVSGQFSIRRGDWKLIFCAGSGGWSAPKDSDALMQGLPKFQLYDMKNDPRETKNIINAHPELVGQLTQLMKTFIEDGRSTPGEKQLNHDGKNSWRQLSWMMPTKTQKEK